MKTGPSRKTSTPSARRVSEPIPRVSNSRIARALAFAAPAENDVTDIVPEAQPARLEFGQRTVSGARGKPGGGVLEQRLGGEHGEHLLRVVLPVGCRVKVATRGEAHCELMDEARLQQPALVVPLFRPGIGEENVD